MACLPLRSWWTRLPYLSGGGRRRTGPPRPHRRQLRVEVLEGRDLPSTVTTLADAGAGSLRQALLDTPAGGIVDFQPGLTGTITLTTGELAITKDLHIAGPGADVITVSGNNASRVFDIAGSVTVDIAGLMIADGFSNGLPGGGIFNAGTLTVAASSFSGNSAGNSGGGGIYSSGALTVMASTFSGNTSGGGGGIWNNLATVTVTASTFSGNSARELFAGYGGGIENYQGTVTITASTFSGNTGSGAGGIASVGTLMVTASTFSGNTGGGIYNNSGTLTVMASTFTGNAGSGITSFGPLTVMASTFTGNSADYGGGIFGVGPLTVTASTLSGNNGYCGGGIYSDTGPLTVTASTLSGNSADFEGGGICNVSGPLTVTASTLSGNSADFEGGGIDNAGDLATISASTLSGNSAGFGGGIVTGGPLTVTASTLSGNSATGNSAVTGDGGGIWTIGTLTVTDSTLSGNSAVNDGGGIYTSSYPTAVTVIASTTLSGNSARSGGGIWNGMQALAQLRNTIVAGNTADSAPDLDGAFVSLGHNLIGDGTGGSGYDPTDLVGTSANPIDPRLGPLADNGGPTQTLALLPGSPAIDAGDNTDAPEWDQRGPGFPRIVNGIIDIGAFEFQGEAAPTVTCSIADPLLWPPNHRLVNVGLGVTVDPPDAALHLQVYADDGAVPADVAAIGPGTLQLRAERQGNGSGRVYLIVVTATTSGGTSFDVCTVAVPHDQSARSIAAAQQQAADAAAYYREFQTAPPGYALLGEGPDDGSGAPPSRPFGRSVRPAAIPQWLLTAPAIPPISLDQEAHGGTAAANFPAEPFRSAWAWLSVDGGVATTPAEGFQPPPRQEQTGLDEGSGSALDPVAADDRLAVGANPPLPTKTPSQLRDT